MYQDILSINILLNLNENSYKPEDIYLKLSDQLKSLTENENITIDKYFETISNNYSNWGESFYISNISIKADEPYLLFRPKLRPKLLEFFPDNFTIGFKISPNIGTEHNQYKPFLISEFVKLVESEQRDWEIEVICNIYNTKNKPNEKKEYIDNAFVSKLPLISFRTKEKISSWCEYLEWKNYADLTTSFFCEVDDCLISDSSYSFKLNKKLPLQIVKEINEYGIYLLSKEDVEIQYYEDNGKQKQRLVYINKDKRLLGERKIINGKKQYISDIYFEGFSKNKINRFKYENGYLSINIKSINNYKKISFIVIIEKDKRLTNTKLISNIDLFQKQGGYAPFLSSYLFDIKKARIPTESNELEFYNKNLTDEQKKAVQIMYDAPDIALIQGPPGTGKTTVIAECIYQYVKQGKKVMLTSESNDAVDNALERLFDEPDVIPLRLTSSYRNNDSKFSKDEATRTYFQESLANPARKTIEDFENKEEIYKDYLKTYNDFKSFNEKFIKYINTFNNIQRNIDILNKEDNILKYKEKEIKDANQGNENFTNLKEKIENIDLNIKTIGDGLNKNIIEIFNNTVLVETEKLTTNFFTTELTDTEKSTFVRTNYIKDGLNKFFKSQTILSKVKRDLSYINSLESSEIVKKGTIDKIEELQYRMNEAQENGDKKAYNEYKEEKSKFEREKGLNIQEYIIKDTSFLDLYFILYEQTKYKNDLKQIKDTLSKFEEIKSLDKDISRISESISKIEKEILKLEQNIKNENNLLNQENATLQSFSNTIKSLENDKQKLEASCQEYLTKIKSFKLFDLQNILNNLELSTSSISNTKRNLIDLQLKKREIKQKSDEQKCLKNIEQELDSLIDIVNANSLDEEKLNETQKNLDSEENSKVQKLNKKDKNDASIKKSKEQLNKFKDSWFLTKLANGFDKENEEKNIISLTSENEQLTLQVNSIDKKIYSFKDKIKTLKSKINIDKEKINTKIASIKAIDFYKFNEIVKKLEKNNIKLIHKEVKNKIWSNTELKEFKIKQENLILILDDIQELENEFRQLTSQLSEIEKVKKQKSSTEENLFMIQEKLKKLETDIDSKKLVKTTSEEKLEQKENKRVILENLCAKDEEEELLHQKTQIEEHLQELLEINTDEKKEEYLNIKLGQKANKDEATKLLEYFVETFENENKIYNKSLETFLEISQQHILSNPVEKFDEKAKININNQIIEQTNELNKLKSNINNVENQIKNIKSKLKKENIDNDTILKYLKDYIKKNKINDNEQNIRPLIENWVKNIQEHTPTKEEEKTYFEHINVVGITLNASEKMLKDINLEYFDVVIVDEISKSTPPEYLRGMMRAKKAILVGDHRQLPPLFSYHGQDFSFEDGVHDEQNNPELSLENFNKYKNLVTASQFQEFFTEADERIKYRLTKQFRMHTDIMDLINCFYGNQLIQGISEDPRKHNKEKMHNIYIPNFIEKKDHAVWVDTSKIFGKEYNRQIQDSTTKKNPFEAFLTIEALKKIDEALYQQYEQGEKKLSIGIISFYLGQVDLLEKMVKKCNLKYFDFDEKNKESSMISTVDSFQGRDRDIILVDLISTKRKVGKENFVSSFQRINVAFSRAKKLLVIFGSKDIFDDYEVEMPDIDNESIIKKEKVYKRIANIIRQNGCNKESSSISDISNWNLQKEKYGYTNE